MSDITEGIWDIEHNNFWTVVTTTDTEEPDNNAPRYLLRDIWSETDIVGEISDYTPTSIDYPGHTTPSTTTTGRQNEPQPV